ncbi:MAG: glycine cleavage system aminomethyltransferase GcvT [Firmicutes bacterium]|nr:glycine cleavage system aminomethyltransferase GcvT [Bacillota bacterium]
MESKTPLYNCHVQAGGKIVPFAGYLMPIQYSGIIAEHMAVRERAGLFDISHMGEFLLEGPDAVGNLNRLLTNDYSNLQQGAARYSPMCNEQGGIIDDVIVYNYGNMRYVIVVNASNKEKDYKWIQNNLFGNVVLTDISDQTALIALQGPLAQTILQTVTKALPQKRFTVVADADIYGAKCNISRTGYTGEDGFEIYCDAQKAVDVWNALLTVGEPHGLIPCGLGARDTLRLEAALPLYGHEMNDDITPLEAGLGFFVKADKDDFIGKKAILEKNSSLNRVGIKITDKGIARENCNVYSNDKKIGIVTSGTYCPFLGGAYAMALVDGEASGDITVEVRGKRLAAEIVDLPFYKK